MRSRFDPAVFCLATAAAIFAIVAFLVASDLALPLDRIALRAFRRPEDPSRLAGPLWADTAALLVTRLGSWKVLAGVLLAVAAWIAGVARRPVLALLLAASTLGMTLDPALKATFQRPRPTEVAPIGGMPASPSFPSGHALDATVAYLAAALALGRVVSRRAARLAAAAAVLLAVLVGTSRVVLGVHYPSDVAAGWAAGCAWVALWYDLVRRFDRPGPPSARRPP
jgi:undecaprenyl-diphosphatase